jgi:hypothetical protein
VEPEDMIILNRNILNWDRLGKCKVQIDQIRQTLEKKSITTPDIEEWIKSIPSIVQFYSAYLTKAQQLKEDVDTTELNEHLSEKCFLTTDLHIEIFRMPNSIARTLIKDKDGKDNFWLQQILEYLKSYKIGDDISTIFTCTQLMDQVKVLNMQRIIVQLDRFEVGDEILGKRNNIIEILLKNEIITQDFIDTTNEHVPLSNHDDFKLPGDKPLVYLKRNKANVKKFEYTLRPSKEHLVSALYQLLNIPIPQTGLLIIDQVKVGKAFLGPFIFQVSEAISGEVATKVLSKNENTVFDTNNYGKQIFGCVLTNPSDGKPDNYIVVENNNIIPIDNDLSFEPKFFRGTYINVKSILLYLPEIRANQG